MRFHINKHSEVPVHQQLREQIIFLIGAGELSIGQPMPSVRECARRYGVHKSTVARAYADLVREGWLVSRPGSRLMIVERARSTRDHAPGADSLDDVIDRTIQLAQKRGHSLQQLSARIQKRLSAEPPDHFLIVEPERGLGELMREEIREAIGYAPETCSMSMLRLKPGLAVAAALLTPRYLVDGLQFIPAAHRNIVPITYVPMKRLIETISNLSEPSTLAMLSVTAAGLKTVSGLIGGLVGDRHSFQLILMESHRNSGASLRKSFRFRRFTPDEYSVSRVRGFAVPAQEPGVPSSTNAGATDEASIVTERDLDAVDLLVCDSVTYKAVRHPRRIRYQLISDESIREIRTAARSLVTLS